MTRSHFEPTMGAETFEPGARYFCKCYKCKKRWVSESIRKVQPGRTMVCWMNSKTGGWERDYHAETRRTLHKLAQAVCPECGYGSFERKGVDGSLNLDKKCDGRCLSAKGPNCNCAKAETQ